MELQSPDDKFLREEEASKKHVVLSGLGIQVGFSVYTGNLLAASLIRNKNNIIY